MSLIYLGLQQAIEWLHKAFDERFIWLVYLNVDPLYDPLRGHPDFEALVARMQFPAASAVTH